jgi:tripeptide aminopeptidase
MVSETTLPSRIIDMAIAIQQIPAPTFHEARRAEFVRTRFVENGLEDVEIDQVGNVYARIGKKTITHGTPGDDSSAKRKPLVVSAHLDTVFSREVNLKIIRQPSRIQGAGIGDNSLGVAGLFGLAWALRERSIDLPGDLWLVGNVGEEGLGNLRGMQAVMDRFGSLAQAFVVLEGTALGQVFQRGLGVRRFSLGVQTAGGHSWHDYGQPSAIHELSAISAKIAALQPPRVPRTTLNVGIIAGGTSINTIAAQASLELDLRSENAAALQNLVRQVEQIASSAEKPGVKVTLETIGQRPSGELPEEHWLVRLAQESLREVGIEPHLNIGSTDANLPLSMGLPAVTIGLTTGAGGHTTHEYINIAPLAKGVEHLVRLVRKAWD